MCAACRRKVLGLVGPGCEPFAVAAEQSVGVQGGSPTKAFIYY